MVKKIINNGFGPKVLSYFNKGRIEEWIESNQILDSRNIKGNFIINVANKLRLFHDKINMNHNDLSLTNILIKESSIVFINFEYVDKKNIYFDIANFFCEFIYNYNSSEWYIFDINLFPSKCFIKLFCKHYFNTNDNEIINNHISNILLKIPEVHKYRIMWSKKFNNLDYKIYGIS